MLLPDLIDLDASAAQHEVTYNADMSVLRALLQSSSITADSATRSNATTDCDVLTMSVDGATAETGTVYEFEMAGVQSCSGTDCDLTAYIKVGSTKITTAIKAVGMASFTNRPWRARGSVTIRSATTCIGSAELKIDALGIAIDVPLAATTITNVIAPFQVVAGFAWGTAVSGTSAHATTCTIRRTR